MSDRVPTEDIERIVGVERHEWAHIGRVVTDDQRIYVLHSQHCFYTHDDLRACRYSTAMDQGLWPEAWEDWEDTPVFLDIDEDGYLVPQADKEPS